MKIFNTLSRTKEEFVPLEEGKVKMYVCGPTVYNFIHIGNARPMIVFDTVRRYFEYKGYDVNYVSNFTDVDDKIIKKAIEEGVSSDEISKRYIAECKKDMEGMNIKPATKNPLATEEICGMVDMIQTLIDKGYAYEKNGTVYYRTRKFKDYGKLSHKNLDDLRSGERSLLVTGEDEKEDPLDFVLWKPKKEGEPAWQSPWCDGRPGWHIECSEMSKKYLGEQIDIHAETFPHSFRRQRGRYIRAQERKRRQCVRHNLRRNLAVAFCARQRRKFRGCSHRLRRSQGSCRAFGLSGSNCRQIC